MIRVIRFSPFETFFHSVVTTSSVPLAHFSFRLCQHRLRFLAQLHLLTGWRSEMFIHLILQLQGRLDRKRLLSIWGAIVLAGSGVLGSMGLRHTHGVGKPGRVLPTANVVTKNEPDVPRLTIEHIIQHGHIVEIQASVPPGATVMVNGQRAAVIWGDGEIKHFVGPLPDGVSEIAITVQNDIGGINTQRISVSLP